MFMPMLVCIFGPLIAWVALHKPDDQADYYAGYAMMCELAPPLFSKLVQLDNA